MRHSPGPWRPSYEDIGWYVVGPHSEEIAAVPMSTETERAADARLLAAAPELLEALRALVVIGDWRAARFDSAVALIRRIEGEP